MNTDIRSVIATIICALGATVIIVMGYSLKSQAVVLAETRTELASTKQKHADEVAMRNAAIASDMQRITTNQRKALDEKDQELQALRRSAAGADRRVAGLLDQLATARAAAADQGRAATAPEGGQAVDIYELFGQSVIEYRALAEEAERARIAGLLCERSYDALTSADKSFDSP